MTESNKIVSIYGRVLINEKRFNIDKKLANFYGPAPGKLYEEGLGEILTYNSIYGHMS